MIVGLFPGKKSLTFLCSLHKVCSHIMGVERLSRGLVSNTCTHCGPIFIYDLPEEDQITCIV